MHLGNYFSKKKFIKLLKKQRDKENFLKNVLYVFKRIL